jgi:hypothetical protein
MRASLVCQHKLIDASTPVYSRRRRSLSFSKPEPNTPLTEAEESDTLPGQLLDFLDVGPQSINLVMKSYEAKSSSPSSTAIPSTESCYSEAEPVELGTRPGSQATAPACRTAD